MCAAPECRQCSLCAPDATSIFSRNKRFKSELIWPFYSPKVRYNCSEIFQKHITSYYRNTHPCVRHSFGKVAYFLQKSPLIRIITPWLNRMTFLCALRGHETRAFSDYVSTCMRMNHAHVSNLTMTNYWHSCFWIILVFILKHNNHKTEEMKRGLF